LIGNWGSDFSDGKAPTEWQGTDEILQNFMESEKQPVKYAQCWVFGAVLTTLMRTLGVPARQLTNFNSGHESPGEDGKYTHELK